MAKKRKTIPAPLKLVHKIADAYPSAWEIVEDFREQRGLSVPDGDEICYIPISATLAIDKIIGSWIASAAAWRIHKVQRSL